MVDLKKYMFVYFVILFTTKFNLRQILFHYTVHNFTFTVLVSFYVYFTLYFGLQFLCIITKVTQNSFVPYTYSFKIFLVSFP